MLRHLKRLFTGNKPAEEPSEIARMREIAQSLADSFEYEQVDGEPLPPWLMYPQALSGSMAWRMGAGEEYLIAVFYPYWWHMNAEDQSAYLAKFDLGADWPDRPNWMAALDRNRLPPSERT